MKMIKINLKIISLFLLYTLSFMLMSCLDSGDSSEPNSKTAGISNYVGEWFFNGAGFNEEKTLLVSDALEYRQTVDAYESSSQTNLTSNRVIEGIITQISENENNSEFDSVFIDIIRVSVTPESEQQANAWNSNNYGAESNWKAGETKIFNKKSPGEKDGEAIWKSNILIAVKREGELLEVNERAGFDGDDPEHQIYFMK